MNLDYSSLIRKLRAKLNVSQEELARVLGVSFSSVNRWENERYEPNIIDQEKLKDLCKENNIDLED